jgi:phosphoribosylglycinamide formyltransferase-1
MRSALSARAGRHSGPCAGASQFADREAFDRELMHEIDAYAPDLVVLAGYMRILSPAFVATIRDVC